MRSLRYYVLFLVALSLVGCAEIAAYTKEFGSFEPNKEVGRAFETYQVNPDLNYYVSGSDVYPNAIMGLKKQYTLETPLWKHVDMTSGKLRDMVQGMQQKADELGLYLVGWSMRDEGGRAIGTWYSILFATTSIKVEENNKVDVYRPPQNTYIKYEGDHDRRRE
jgi:hypothetical protein